MPASPERGRGYSPSVWSFGGVSTPGIRTGDPLRAKDAWVPLTLGGDRRCARLFTIWPCAGWAIIWVDAASGICTRSNPTSGSSMVGGGMGERVAISVGPGCGDTARVSVETRLSRAVEHSTSDAAGNMSTNPPAGGIQPVHRAATTIRSKITRPRDKGAGRDRGGSASPCHSHKPVSSLSALTDFASGSTIAPRPRDPEFSGAGAAASPQPIKPACPTAR